MHAYIHTYICTYMSIAVLPCANGTETPETSVPVSHLCLMPPRGEMDISMHPVYVLCTSNSVCDMRTVVGLATKNWCKVDTCVNGVSCCLTLSVMCAL